MVEPTIEGYRIHTWGGDLRWERFDRPHVGPGEVLVEVEACAVGLTTLNCIRGDLADDDRPLPLVPGHEFVGRVVAAADTTAQRLVGQRIAAYFYLSCGTCPPCLAGWEQRCDDLAGFVGVHRGGGYAPFATLPTRNAITVPDDVDPVVATVIPDAVATPVHVCGERARLLPTDRVVVIGAGGGIGAHLVQVAALYGSQVLAVDTDAGKLADLERLGIRCMSAGDLEVATPSTLFAGGAPTVVVDLVGAPSTLSWGHDALGVGGRLVIVTTFRDHAFAADPRTLVFREAAIIASRYARRSEVAEAARLVARGDIEPVLGEVVPVAEVQRLHAALERGELLGRGAIRWSEGSSRADESPG